MSDCLNETLNGKRSVIISSNRGPVTFQRDANGEIAAQRGSGGLVTALSGLAGSIDATWVSCAFTEEDAEWDSGTVALSEAGGHVRVKFVNPDKAAYEGYYNVISNPLLWFLQHQMWNLPNAPVIDQRTWKAWEHGYVAVNRLFADAIIDQLGNSLKPRLVMLQDYHQYLIPKMIREALRPAERPTIMHFTHIPWPGPDYWSILPPTMRMAIIEGMCAADIVGFQTRADSLNFLRTCQTYLSRAYVKYLPRRVWFRNHATYSRDFPISIDVDSLRSFNDSPEVAGFTTEIKEISGNRQMVLRIDRIDPSKNIVRGFQAFGELLDLHPEHREKVSFLTLLVPSRLEVNEYQSYLDELMGAAGQINANYGTSEWEPIRVLVGENYPRAIAALQHYDVLLVNSIADGMNLVAKEGSIVNQQDGVLILSERTGARQQLESGAIIISPCDVYATAEAIHQALVMNPYERAERAKRLRWAVESDNIHDWFCNQLAAVDELAKK